VKKRKHAPEALELDMLKRGLRAMLSVFPPEAQLRLLTRLARSIEMPSGFHQIEEPAQLPGDDPGRKT
jgi:hypothetical protein